MKLINGLLILTATSFAWCQAPVPKEALALRKSFDDKVTAEVNALRTSVMVPVERRYIDALKKGIKGVQQNGHLEEIGLVPESRTVVKCSSGSKTRRTEHHEKEQTQ